MTVDEAIQQLEDMAANEYDGDREAVGIVQAEIERLTHWEDIVQQETEHNLRHMGLHTLADRFAESVSPIHQRLGMVIHVLAADAAERGA